MGNVLAVVWTVIGFVVFHTAMLVWAALMLPNPVERARQRVERQAGRHFFLGAALTVVDVILALAFLQAGGGPLQLIGWIVLSPVLISGIIGGAAFARLLAARIQRQMKNEAPLPALVGGALCTALCGFLPIMGWFIFFPLTGFISVGAGFLALVSRKRVAEQPQPQVMAVPVAPPAAAYPAAYGYPAHTGYIPAGSGYPEGQPQPEHAAPAG